jgi:hypothetical protein
MPAFAQEPAPVDMRVYNNGRDRIIPLMNWNVNQAAAQQTLRARAGAAHTKASTDLGSIFRPLAPCRIVDTRGNGAPIQGGQFLPNTQRTMVAGGICGIPSSDVIALSLTVVTFNHTVNTGGFISLVAPGAAITGTNDIFNFGSQWSGTSVIAPSNGTGSFDVYVSQATADVIIDVNGYYNDLNQVNIDTQMDIAGTTPFELLEITNADTTAGSSTLVLHHGGSVGQALRISSGGLNVGGAGVNSSSFVTVHKVDTSNNFGTGTGTLCGGFPGYSVIDNPYSNGDPNAVLFVSPIRRFPGSATPISNNGGLYAVYYLPAGNACSNSAAVADKWAVVIDNGTGTTYNNGETIGVMIIKP